MNEGLDKLFVWAVDWMDCRWMENPVKMLQFQVAVINSLRDRTKVIL